MNPQCTSYPWGRICLTGKDLPSLENCQLQLQHGTIRCSNQSVSDFWYFPGLEDWSKDPRISVDSFPRATVNLTIPSQNDQDRTIRGNIDADFLISGRRENRGWFGPEVLRFRMGDFMDCVSRVFTDMNNDPEQLRRTMQNQYDQWKSDTTSPLVIDCDKVRMVLTLRDADSNPADYPGFRFLTSFGFGEPWNIGLVFDSGTGKKLFWNYLFSLQRKD